MSDRSNARARGRAPLRRADNARPEPPRRLHPAACDEQGNLKLLDKRSHDPHRRAVLLVSLPLAVATIAFGILFLYNHVLAGGAVFLPVEAVAQEQGWDEGRLEELANTAGDGGGIGTPALSGTQGGAPAPSADDRVATATVRYLSEIVIGNSDDGMSEPVSAQVSLDERWFSQDSSVYNHELARTCIALSAVVNSESWYYGGRTDIDFVTEALCALGFVDIRTDSFAGRSAAGDEVAAIFTGKTDVTAYAFARRPLADGRDLVFVGVRGTYGSEWLSNFNIDEADADQHSGFTRATDDIAAALAVYCAETGVDIQTAVALVCGHSRGGAVANLLAASLDDQANGRGFAPERVFAYTFAAPNTTQDERASDGRYGNIFNVVNATDIIPRVPLEAWGWRRYGTTVELPAPGTDGFCGAYEDMQLFRAELTQFYNAKSPFPDASVNIVDTAEDRIAENVPDFASLMTLEGITQTIKAFGNLEVGQVVASHYPDTYLSWLNTLETGQLAFS